MAVGGKCAGQGDVCSVWGSFARDGEIVRCLRQSCRESVEIALRTPVESHVHAVILGSVDTLAAAVMALDIIRAIRARRQRGNGGEEKTVAVVVHPALSGMRLSAVGL